LVAYSNKCDENGRAGSGRGEEVSFLGWD